MLKCCTACHGRDGVTCFQFYGCAATLVSCSPLVLLSAAHCFSRFTPATLAARQLYIACGDHVSAPPQAGQRQLCCADSEQDWRESDGHGRGADPASERYPPPAVRPGLHYKAAAPRYYCVELQGAQYNHDLAVLRSTPAGEAKLAGQCSPGRVWPACWPQPVQTTRQPPASLPPTTILALECSG